MAAPVSRVSVDLVIVAVKAALVAASGSITWPAYSGAVQPAIKPPFLRIGECSEEPSATMGLRGSVVHVPIHAFRADGSAVGAGAMISAVAGVLEAPGALTVTGRTVADVSLMGIEDAGIDNGDGKAEAHYIGRFDVWVR